MSLHVDFQKALSVLVLTLLFINIDIGKALGIDNNIGAFYILLPLLIAFSPLYLSGFKNIAFILLFVFALFSAIAAFRFGMNFETTRILIAMLSFLVGFSLSKSMTEHQVSKLFNFVGAIVLLFISARFLMSYDIYLAVLTNGAPIPRNYQYLTAGGRNIEVTYLFFLSALCSNRRIALTIFIFTGALSVIYMSRVGVILFVLVLLFFASKKYDRKTLALLSVAAVLIIFTVLSILSPATLQRFLDFRQEIEYGMEGIGRLGLYTAAIELINLNYLGYGTGNSMGAATALTGLAYKENNFHNIYLQIFVDLGVFSFLLLILFTAWFVKKSLISKQKNKFALLGCAYFIVGLIQFTGLDALGWLCIGLAMPYFKSGNKCELHNG